MVKCPPMEKQRHLLLILMTQVLIFNITAVEEKHKHIHIFFRRFYVNSVRMETERERDV